MSATAPLLLALAAAPPCPPPTCPASTCRTPRPAGCGTPCGRAVYRCEVAVGTEPGGRARAAVEREVVCVPPILTSPLDGLRGLFGRKDENGGGCDAPTSPRRAGWLSRLTGGGGGGVRSVRRLGSRPADGPPRATYDWTAVRVDACGRATLPAAEEPDGDDAPPAPAPPTDAGVADDALAAPPGPAT